MIQEIKSRDNSLIKYVNKLKDNSFSKEEKKFIIEGIHLVEMAKNNLLYVLTEKKLDEKMYPNQYLVTKEILEKLSNNKSSSSVIGICKFIDEKDDNDGDILYLEDVQDPGNVGTLFRTALAFNIKNIYVSEKTAYKYNLKVIQASQGSIFDLNIKILNIEDLIKLKEKQYKIITTSLSKNSVYLNDFKFDKNQKYIVILGNEGQGVSQIALKEADIVLKIRMENIDSLNVAIAGGIILNSIYNKWFIIFFYKENDIILLSVEKK